MDISIAEEYINNNEVEYFISYAKSISASDYSKLIKWLIRRLGEYKIPDESKKRNTAAYIIGELKCTEAVPPIIELLKRDSHTMHIGTLVYSLHNLECSNYLDQIFHLFYEGNYEVRRTIFDLFEINKGKIPLDMYNRMKQKLKREIDKYKDILLGLYITQDEIFDDRVNLNVNDGDIMKKNGG